jgi:hypothetical protein
MFSDIVVVDNIFDNPDELVNYTEYLKFFDSKSYPDSSDHSWSGLRTLSLNTVSKELYDSANTVILSRAFGETYGANQRGDLEISWDSTMYLHKMTSEDTYNDSWLHKDTGTIYAGVIYLSKNPPPLSGTVIVVNGEERIIHNKYNRLVLYRSDYPHAAMRGFDTRLTMNIFYKNISFGLSYQEKENNA